MTRGRDVLDWLVQYHQRQIQRGPTLRLAAGALLFLILGQVALAMVGRDDWLGGLSRVFLGAALGYASWKVLDVRLAWRGGWLSGRLAMVGSLGEAVRREIDLREWLELELERDLAFMDGSDDR